MISRDKPYSLDHFCPPLAEVSRSDGVDKEPCPFHLLSLQPLTLLLVPCPYLLVLRWRRCHAVTEVDKESCLFHLPSLQPSVFTFHLLSLQPSAFILVPFLPFSL
jgi:hypothetical protein